MPVCRGGILGAGTAILVAVLGLPAVAYAWTAPNPKSNYPEGALPDSCWSDPSGAECISAGISYLDNARASMGQPPYVLPTNFDSLTPAEQAFVLTDLDRILYGLPPVPGLTSALDQAAAGGVRTDNDPTPSDNNYWGYASNWAGGYENMVLAYGGWMYDDGPGSGNVDCTTTDSTGCWGHRQDILWKVGSGVMAMGAAAGNDPSGTAGYAMLLEQHAPGWNPTYIYTWSQAVAEGAKGTTLPGFGGAGNGTGKGSPNASAAGRSGVTIRSLRVHGHQLSLTISAPHSSSQSCVLRRLGRHGWYTMHTIHCSQRVTFNHLPAGRYRVRVRSPFGSQTRRARVP